jgi:hypothetical protein
MAAAVQTELSDLSELAPRAAMLLNSPRYKVLGDVATAMWLSQNAECIEVPSVAFRLALDRVQHYLTRHAGDRLVAFDNEKMKVWVNRLESLVPDRISVEDLLYLSAAFAFTGALLTSSVSLIDPARTGA